MCPCTVKPLILYSSVAVTGNAALQVYPLGQMNWVAGTRQVGIIVLSGPVARVSRITALEDLSKSSGWPIVGVVGVPRVRRRWWARRVQPAARGTEPVGSAVYGAGAEHSSDGGGQ